MFPWVFLGMGGRQACREASMHDIVTSYKELAVLVTPGGDTESRREGSISSAICSSLHVLIFVAFCIHHFF